MLRIPVNPACLAMVQSVPLDNLGAEVHVVHRAKMSKPVESCRKLVGEIGDPGNPGSRRSASSLVTPVVTPDTA